MQKTISTNSLRSKNAENETSVNHSIYKQEIGIPNKPAAIEIYPYSPKRRKFKEFKGVRQLFSSTLSMNPVLKLTPSPLASILLSMSTEYYVLSVVEG